jgi:hypothetical protein
MTPSFTLGKVLSGGMDSNALQRPKWFFGAQYQGRLRKVLNRFRPLRLWNCCSISWA